MKERAKPTVGLPSCGECEKPMSESRRLVCAHIFFEAFSFQKKSRTMCLICGVVQGTTQLKAALILYKLNLALMTLNVALIKYVHERNSIIFIYLFPETFYFIRM